ncbi:MAG: protease inhibitor I42 family protein [Deferrisomatales bacterium]
MSVTLHLAAIAAVSWGAETVIVNQSFHGREINLRAGATLQVELEQPGATGHLWELRDLDPEHLELLGVETREPSDPDRTGAPLGKTWRLRALRPGTANLTFLLLRPWEGPGEAVDTFALRVRIL